ncbi:hypothetical protein H6G20_05605 [Desertifilum sp. FACHB-1129]|uniref:hypothetical protein n=1 Tax=unclassified Desertifilum TaxID=2621682 RepID=UPI001689606A|nr:MULTISPECIES: hypothetical protein [unclassified Desertifilum]MBD2311153.1 hypothetical protein [Desertifilum sp. FACHB-1129]MBD2324020.1 hypothetical protein [Desertifilum sp. FACHB-866]MBD2333955.1 hypothetical protein [Desertifilum sp. FACHB-868]MDA0211267.1 hypothetical protein [Cyanobacteria bacterium FC1]
MSYPLPIAYARSPYKSVEESCSALAASDLVEVGGIGDRYCQVIKSTLVKLGAAGSNLPDIRRS